MDTPHEIHKMDSAGVLMYAIIPDDGSRGYLMGERREVEQLRDKLNALLDRNEYDGEISSDFEQLGHKWITVPEAAQLILEVSGDNIPTRTIRYACKNGHIKGAEMQGRDWRFPQTRFLHWVNNRPKTGRKG